MRAIGSVLLILFIRLACVAGEQTVDFKLKGGYLIAVRCSMGNLKDLTAIVDTGATESVVDISVVKRLGLATRADRATFLTQEVKVFAVSIPAFQIGDAIFGPEPGIAADLHSLTSQFGIRPDILIGMDVIGRTNILIDYKNLRLSFTSAAIPVMAHKATIVGTSNVPMVEAEFHGKHLRLQVDTGSPRVMLFGDDGRSVSGSSGDVELASPTHNLVARSVRADSLRLSDTYISNTEVFAFKESPQAGFDGVLGTRVLHARKIGLDFARRKLTWE